LRGRGRNQKSLEQLLQVLFIFGKMKIASGCFGEQLKNVDACTETDHIAANVFHLYFFERRKNVAWVAVRQA
jgi:hypothetical protein